MNAVDFPAAWLTLLRAVRAARDAGYLGPRAAARAAAEALTGAEPPVWLAAATLLASQAAKGAFQTDLDVLHRLLADGAPQAALPGDGLSARPSGRPVRFRPLCRQSDPLPLEEARAVPITELMTRYGVELRRVGRELVGRCPFHDDRRPSLWVSPAEGLWHCFPCAVGGDGIAFVMRLKGIDFPGAVLEVAGC